MKKQFLLYVFALCATTATAVSCMNIRFNQVKASGIKNVETRNVNGNPDAIKVEDVVKVVFTQGSKMSLRIEGDRNFIPYVNTKTKNGCLEIEMSRERVSYHNLDVTVFVTLPDLKKIQVEDAARFECNAIVNPMNLDIKVEDASSLLLGKAEVGMLRLHLSDASNARILSGKAREADIKVGDASGLDAANFLIERADIKVEDASSAVINAASCSRAHVQDASSLKLMRRNGQNPMITDMRVNDSATLSFQDQSLLAE